MLPQIAVIGLVAALGYLSLGLALDRPLEPSTGAAPRVSPTPTIARAVTFTPLALGAAESTRVPAAGASTPTARVTPSRVADVTPATGMPTASIAPAATATPTTYTVQDGDTMEAISQKFGVSIEAIARASHLSDPDRLSIGDKLTIPPK